MKQLACFLLLLCGGALSAQDPAPANAGLERLKKALPYLSSAVPEQKLSAEQLVSRGATEHFDALVAELPGLPRLGRESLLRILAGTRHEGRISLCVGVLCTNESRRGERVTATRALRDADADVILDLLEARLAAATATRFEQIQCCGILGGVRTARAQGIAERLLNQAGTDDMLHFAAEDALLRSTLEASFAQPAWERYQERHKDAPRATLREMQEALDGLARPSSAMRANAAATVAAMVGSDARLLLALARSRWVERSLFALARLPEANLQSLSLPALWVMLDLVTTAEQAIALRAMQAAIAGAPPTADNMTHLRPAVSPDSLTRLESILEGLSRGGDLVRLRDQKKRLGAKLRPMLARVGGFDPETRAMLLEFKQLKTELDQLEKAWEGGWRREFEAEILGLAR